MDDWQNAGFGLYVHWPFCQSKCPYCDFNSHVAAAIDQKAWADAYIREINRIAALVPGRSLKTIYFGGGTPSLMAPETVAAVIQAASTAWSRSNDIEITLEANPTSVEAGRFQGYKDAGVNRISLGVQALNDEDLRRLGRMHSAAEARTAFETAASLFDRVSFDLIYARQDQSLQAWRKELQGALAMSVGHLSLYQLTIEDGTVFGERHARGLLKGLPNEDLGADFYDLTQDLCGEAGLPAYEVSNHAKPGQESRHNLIYWQAGDYAGVGPGAHGRLTLDQRIATSAEKNPALWLASAISDGGVQDFDGSLSSEDRGLEYLLMGLRLSDGISTQRLSAMLQRDLKPSVLNELQDLGMIQHSNGQLQVTDKGRPLLNQILKKLTEAL